MKTGSALDALNFAVAGAREGFGPFLGVYLQQQGFDPAIAGLAMGLAGAAGLVATTPIGALVDRIKAKRTALAFAVWGIALGAVLLVATKVLWLIGVAQLIIGIADTSIAPVVAALTLGLAGGAAYGERVARNEVFNHAGNAANAALAGLLGYAFGLGYVTIAIVVMAGASSMVIFRIKAQAIDHSAARGGAASERPTFRVLFEKRSLLLLAATVFAFQAANGAMLPFLAQARAAAGSDASLTTGWMTVMAQSTMVGISLLTTRLSHRRGHGGLMSAALVAVILRGILAAFASSWWLVAAVQALEGVASGLTGVAIPALAAKIMSGTGHANAGLGALMTAYGAGAMLSPVLAGLLAQRFGFSASFIGLAILAGAGSLLWSLGFQWLHIEKISSPSASADRDPGRD